ncbi:GNAT family N-acetyltransferase [Caldalkalibacillus mannanilyticus]|uniref:GNAT family N-acetyltransferase n=1 Tax=Caldalkalibacillus mannanilyticus TaxID=1418 RepID=UPI000468E952|nr:GNAT family N-acetyltransferase [Caldalkalibacillus mannanilyticus]
MSQIIRLEKVTEDDVEEIRDLMVEVEEDETARWFDNGERPYIPGFHSVDMQKYHMWDHKYFKIMADGSLAGVILVSSTGREHARIDRFYMHPQFQGKGIGYQVIDLIEKAFPEVKLWTLDTTQKSVRNHYFYEKCGYVLSGEDEEERYYYKTIGELPYHMDKYLTDQDLRDYNYRRCHLENADFHNVNLRNSAFSYGNMSSVTVQNINFSHSRITNTNLSHSTIGDSNMRNVEICHVSLAGAHIHDVNLDLEDEEKVPVVMERCDLRNSRIIDSNLKNVEIEGCDITGMKISGILVSELLKVYEQQKEQADLRK